MTQLKDWPRALANARRRAGLTQAELAGWLGVSRRQIVRWEAGDGIPPPASEAVTQESILARLAKMTQARSER